MNMRYLHVYRQGDQYHLYEIFQIYQGSKIKNFTWGFWCQAEGFNFKQTPSIYKYKDNFEAINMKVGIFKVYLNSFIIIYK